MQLVCPNCDAHYDISPSALGPKGKEVRCAKCAHEWFATNETQEKAEFKLPEGLNDEADAESRVRETGDISQMIPPVAQLDTDDDEEETEDLSSEESAKEKTSEGRARKKVSEGDIPDAVKPRHDQEKAAFAKKKSKATVPMTAKLVGYGAALLIFILVFAAGFALKNDIIKAWPPSAAIYDIAGMPAAFQGEGLIIESLSATVVKNNQGQDVLILEGRVVNLTDETVAVPPLVAKLRTTNGEDGEGWIIDPPVEEIAPGESFSFKSDYPSLPRGIGSVNLTLVPTL